MMTGGPIFVSTSQSGASITREIIPVHANENQW